VIARCHVRDVGSDSFYDARAFVSEHDRRRGRQVLFHDGEIRMANAGCDNAHEHLVRAGLIELELLDGK
jgi:hypothetical protein